jgi:nitrate/nitrite transporter NarK
MGIPYSRQINTAFDQVAPLVTQGFQVLETTKNIAILLAWIQVLTVVLLALILLALAALLVTMNPDLEKEREAYVTPIMKSLMHQAALFVWTAGSFILFSAMIGGLYFAIYGGKIEDDDVGDGAEKEKQEGDVKDANDSAKGKSG